MYSIRQKYENKSIFNIQTLKKNNNPRSKNVSTSAYCQKSIGGALYNLYGCFVTVSRHKTAVFPRMNWSFMPSKLQFALE